MYALNFYSPLVADQLRSHRKTATIRLGDKSGKYKKGMVVRVLCGVRFSPREHVFDAVIDKVEVKTLDEREGAVGRFALDEVANAQIEQVHGVGVHAAPFAVHDV